MFWSLALLEINQSYSSSKELSAEECLEAVYVTVSHHLSQFLSAWGYCFQSKAGRTAQVSISCPFWYKINQANFKRFQNHCYLINEAEVGDTALQESRPSLIIPPASSGGRDSVGQRTARGHLNMWKITSQPVAIIRLQSAAENKQTCQQSEPANHPSKEAAC